MSNIEEIRLERVLVGDDETITDVPNEYNGKPVINVPQRRFGLPPINKQSEEYKIHVKQMDYINKHSESKPKLDSILTHRLMQTVHGDTGHPESPYKDVYLLTYDGIYIHAFLLLHKNSRQHYTYLICHGVKHQIEDLSPVADRFYRDFGNVLIIDYRGFGNSSGKQSERGAYIDVQTAFDYLLTLKEIDVTRIVVYGVSMGVALAIQLATQPDNAKCIHACILENGFASYKDAASDLSIIGKLLPEYFFSVGMRSIDKVHQLRMPVMYLIGLRDDMIKPINTIRLFEKTINSIYVKLQIYEEAGHTNVKNMSNYIRESYIPFMKTVWSIRNPDEPHPHTLAIDHEQ